MPEKVYNKIGKDWAWEVNKKVLDNAMEKSLKVKYVSSDYDEILALYRKGWKQDKTRYKELYYLWDKKYPVKK